MKKKSSHLGIIIVLVGVLALVIPALLNLQSNISLGIGLLMIITGVVLHYILIKKQL